MLFSCIWTVRGWEERELSPQALRSLDVWMQRESSEAAWDGPAVLRKVSLWWSTVHIVSSRTFILAGQITRPLWYIVCPLMCCQHSGKSGLSLTPGLTQH